LPGRSSRRLDDSTTALSAVVRPGWSFSASRLQRALCVERRQLGTFFSGPPSLFSSNPTGPLVSVPDGSSPGRGTPMSSCLRAFLFSALFLLFASASPALTFTINASDSGNYANDGSHAFGDQEYAAGFDDGAGPYLHDYFVFDLSGLPATETILSATLHA